MLCPCGSTLDFDGCCGVYIAGEKNPPTAEALMRSRYTAYTLADTAYISKTMRGKASIGFEENEAKIWAKNVIWLDLKVIRAYQAEDQAAFVEFIATLMENKKIQHIHEVSEFKQCDGVWAYVDGKNPKLTRKVIPAKNAACPCRSGKKYKNCHGK